MIFTSTTESFKLRNLHEFFLSSEIQTNNYFANKILISC